MDMKSLITRKRGSNPQIKFLPRVDGIRIQFVRRDKSPASPVNVCGDKSGKSSAPNSEPRVRALATFYHLN
jgi:hypothetical protein